MKGFIKKLAAVLAVAVLLTAVTAPAASALDSLSTFGELLGGDFGDILNEALSGIGGGGTGTGYSLDDLLNNRSMMDALRERLSNTGNLGIINNEDVQKALSAILTDDIVIDLSDNELLVKMAEFLQNQPATEPAPSTPGSVPANNDPTGSNPTPGGNTTPGVNPYNPNGEIIPGGEAGTTLPVQPSFSYEIPSYVVPGTSSVYPDTQPYQPGTNPYNNGISSDYTYPQGYVQPSADQAALQPDVQFNPSVQENNTPTKLQQQSSNNKLLIGAGLLGISAIAIVFVIIKMRSAQA